MYQKQECCYQLITALYNLCVTLPSPQRHGSVSLNGMSDLAVSTSAFYRAACLDGGLVIFYNEMNGLLKLFLCIFQALHS